ncbi:MAG: alpha/beta fold hydrolase, partial [Gemmatimonadota bacterium]
PRVSGPDGERRMSELAHETVGTEGPSGEPTLYILHGFLGSGRNWTSFARRLVEWRTDWRIVLVDLRLHGASQSFDGPHTVEAAAADLVDLASVLSPEGPMALLGHSFGGKVALGAIRSLAPTPVQTWIIDSTPAAGGEGSGADRLLARLEASPSSFADRDEAIAWITEGGFDDATARWVATNLERRGEGWTWRLDVDALRELLTDFATTELWKVAESVPPDASIHFVRATRGSLLAPDDAERIQRLAARGEPVALHELEGGHWLHTDNPDGLLELVADRLPRLPASG